MDQKQNEQKSSQIYESLHTFELFKDYTLPDWSCSPQRKYVLEIIKNGVVVEERELKEKAFFLVGKLPDLCDLVLEHPSISRKHGILQFHKSGDLYIYDLESTHGIKVNKRPVKTKQYQKLNPFDVIKFGMSTRLMVVRCQKLEEESQNEIQQLKKKNEKQLSNEISQEQLRKQKYLMMVNKQQDTMMDSQIGVSWGIDDEQEVYQHEADMDQRLDPRALRELDDLDEKQLDQINQYEQKIKQYEKFSLQLGHLNEQEQKDFGLPQHLITEKEKLDKKVEDLHQQLLQSEDNLRYSLFKEGRINEKMAKSLATEDTFGDDDFYDRTHKQLKTFSSSQSNTKSSQSVVENFQTLKQKLQQYIQERDSLNTLFLDFDKKNDKNQKQDTDEQDEYELFLQQNEIKLLGQNKNILIEKMKDINQKIDETNALLKIVRPDVKLDINELFERKKPEIKSIPTKQIFSKPESKLEEKKQSNISRNLQKLRELSLKNKEGDYDVEDMAKIAEIIREEEIEEEENEKQKLEQQQRQQQYGLQQQKKKQEQVQNKRVIGVALKPTSRNLKESDVESQEKEDLIISQWEPPTQQTGDGYTSLNQKYGY